MIDDFAKVYSSIVRSSVWLEPHHVLRLWIYMLVTADSTGFVEGSMAGIAGQARLTDTEADEAFARLEAPDPRSKSKEHEGRRILPVENGWLVVNKPRYRDRRDTRPVSMTPEAVRQRRHRAKGVTGVTSRDRERDSCDSSTSTSSSSSVGEEVQEEGSDPVADACVRLAVAANKGLGQPIPRILASSGSTRTVVEILHAADIPVEFSERVVFERASTMTPAAAAEVRSLHYFTRAVVEAWERREMGDRVRESPLRQTGPTGPVRVGDFTHLATCPLCGATGIPYAAWESHFRKTHPRDDVPPFTANLAGGSGAGS